MEPTFDSEICTVCSSTEVMMGTGLAPRVYWKSRVRLLPPGMATKTLTAGECQQSVSLTSKSKPETPGLLASTSVRQTREMTNCRAVSSSTNRTAKTAATPASQRRAFATMEGHLDNRDLNIRATALEPCLETVSHCRKHGNCDGDLRIKIQLLRVLPSERRTLISRRSRRVEHPALAGLVAHRDVLQLLGMEAVRLTRFRVCRKIAGKSSSDPQYLLEWQARLLGK